MPTALEVAEVVSQFGVFDHARTYKLILTLRKFPPTHIFEWAGPRRGAEGVSSTPPQHGSWTTMRESPRANSTGKNPFYYSPPRRAAVRRSTITGRARGGRTAHARGGQRGSGGARARGQAAPTFASPSLRKSPSRSSTRSPTTCGGAGEGCGRARAALPRAHVRPADSGRRRCVQYLREGGRRHGRRSAAAPDAWAEPARCAAGWRRLRPSDAAARSAAGPGHIFVAKTRFASRTDARTQK